MNTLILYPSEFSYISCLRCWWREKHGCKRSGIALPAIFNEIDKGMRKSITVDALRSLGIHAKDVIDVGKLSSARWEVFGVRVGIEGKLDRCAVLDDDTYGIYDFKVTATESLGKFGHQLHAYTQCMETPFSRMPYPVSQIGIIQFDPSQGVFKFDLRHTAAQTGTLKFCELPLNRARFQQHCDHLAEIYSAPLPDPNPECLDCAYISQSIQFERKTLSYFKERGC